MQIDTKPEVRLMPELFSNLIKCECHFGWDNGTTIVFKQNHFNHLVLSGGENQNFIIPNLGEDAKKVSILWLSALGMVKGLDQFYNNVNILDITTVPENSIDINKFINLQSLSLEWDKKIEKKINSIKTLDNLFIRYYKYKDISKLQCIKQINKLSFSQGSVSNIEGVNLSLKSLDLSYLRNYSDVDTINKLTKLTWLSCHNSKKAIGIINLGSFKNLVFVSFVDTNCIFDLKNINKLKNLEKIWSNGEHINLKWKELILLPKLKLVGLFDNGITDEEIKAIAKKANKKIERLFRAGKKKKPHIQITFED